MEDKIKKMESAEDFTKRHFPGIEKETWFPVIVSIADGYVKHIEESKWIDAKTPPHFGGEYNIVWNMKDGEYPTSTSMDWCAIKKVWTDPRCNDIDCTSEVLYYQEIPKPPAGIAEEIWNPKTP